MPTPDFYESINRNAIVVKLKQPFFDWVNAVEPSFSVTQKDEGTVYLIREKVSKPLINYTKDSNFSFGV